MEFKYSYIVILIVVITNRVVNIWHSLAPDIKTAVFILLAVKHGKYGYPIWHALTKDINWLERLMVEMVLFACG